MNEHPDAPPAAGDDTPRVSEPAGTASAPPPPASPPHPPSDSPPSPPGSDAGNPGGPFAARYGLVRPLQGKHVAGVCAAIGRATNTDPVLWRVLLAVTSFFGVGIVVYLVGWLCIPAEGDTASPVEALLGRGRSRTSPGLVVVLGGLTILVLGGTLTEGFRGPLLVAAVVIGGVLLLTRTADRRQAQVAAGYPPSYATAPPYGAPPPYSADTPNAAPTPPAADQTEPLTPTAPYAASYRPAAGPYATPPAPPVAPFATPLSPPGAGGPPAAPVPPGYRPPFAPRGPYAGGGPASAYAPGAGGPRTPGGPAGGGAYPTARPKPPRERSRLGVFTLSLVLLALGGTAALDLANIVDVGAGGYFAAMLAMVGVGLLVGAWVGRARWLIIFGLAFSLGLGIASTAEHIDTNNFGSNAVWRPTSLALLDDQYELNLGNAELDLRQVDFTGQNAAVSARINAGNLKVILPPQVDVTVETKMTAGDARIFDTQWSGINTPSREVTDLGADGPGGGQLRLTIRINAGHLEVHR